MSKEFVCETNVSHLAECHSGTGHERITLLHGVVEVTNVDLDASPVRRVGRRGSDVGVTGAAGADRVATFACKHNGGLNVFFGHGFDDDTGCNVFGKGTGCKLLRCLIVSAFVLNKHISREALAEGLGDASAVVATTGVPFHKGRTGVEQDGKYSNDLFSFHHHDFLEFRSLENKLTSPTLGVARCHPITFT